MKKVLIVIMIFLLSILAVEIYFTYDRQAIEELYILPQSYGYVYDENRKIVFNVYSKKKNTFIQYEEENQYMISGDGFLYTLENVEATLIKQNSIYQIKIIADLPNVECNYNSFKILIENERYSVEFDAGSISISSMNGYELLSINKYYPSYSYINKNLHLVGINVEFHDEYSTLTKMEINGFAKGILECSMPNVEIANEVEIKNIIPNYNVSYISTNPLNLEAKKYFIPISYPGLKLIKEGYVAFELDNKLYYLDNLSFITNDIAYLDYENLMVAGDIKYAES